MNIRHIGYGPALLCLLAASACSSGGSGLPSAPSIQDGGGRSIAAQAKGAFQELPLPAGQQAPDSVAITQAGRVFVSTAEAIDRVESGGTISAFAAPQDVQFIGGLAASADGSVWAPATHLDPLNGPQQRVYRLSPTGSFSFVVLPNQAQGFDVIPADITSTASGQVAYVVQGTFACGAVGFIDTTASTAGATSSFCEPTAVSGSSSKTPHHSQVAADSNGDLFVTQFDRFAPNGGFSAVYRISAQGTVLQTFMLPGNSDPEGIAIAKDRSIWLTLDGLNAIGRLSRSGALKTFPVPTANAFRGYPSASASRIVRGANGSMWFAETGAGKIARITQAGKIAEFDVPTTASGPTGIAACVQACSGETLWFAESAAGRLGSFKY